MTKCPADRAFGSPPPPIDAVLAEIAGRQHGLARRFELDAAGLSRDAIARRVAKGSLHRKYHGVYTVGHARLSREGELLAGVFACGEGAALSHLSAAELWGITRRRSALVHVVVPRRRRVHRPVRVHVSRTLDAGDVTMRDGIPVTTVARLLVDLTDVQTPYQLTRVIKEAAFHELFDAAATGAALVRANGRQRLGVLEEAIRMYLGGEGGTKSANEDAFVPLALRAGLPEPRSNARVAGIEVDFSWRSLPLVVEIDGGGHLLPPVRRDDAWRDDWLRGCGFTVLRFTDFEVKHRPEVVIARLRPGGG